MAACKQISCHREVAADMSNHHSCILQRDSPPSVEFSDEKLDSLSGSCTSMPVTPNSPLDMDDCDIPSKHESDVLYFHTKIENQTIIMRDDDADVKNVHNEIDECAASILSTTDVNISVPSSISLSKIEILSNNITNNSDNSLKCDVDVSKCNQNNDILFSSNENVKNLEAKSKIVPESSIKLEEKKSDSKNSRLESNVPKLISTLTLTDDHPLMVLSSPDSPHSTGNYPDLILPSCKNRDDNRTETRPSPYENNHLLSSECTGMMSLSSTEDESFNRSLANGDMNSLHSESFTNPYEPQRNTSKNNLYFSENFTTSDGCKGVEEFFANENANRCNATEGTRVNLERNSNIQPDILDSGRNKGSRHTSNVNNLNPPDLTVERKKIKPDVRAPKSNNTVTKPASGTYKILGREINPSKEQKLSSTVIVTDKKVCDIVESPTQTKNNHELSIDMPSDLSATDDIPSPDSSSTSRAENERSLYLAEVDPVGGCVTLKPRTSAPVTLPTRKRIKPLPNETDTESTVQSDATLFVSCQNKISGSTSSLDSLSDCSLHSDGAGQDQFIATASNTSTPRAQTNTFMKQISVFKASDADDCSDTETETDGPLRNKLLNNDEDNATPEKIPEYSLSEERQDTRRWLKVTLPSGEKRTIDMKVIEPYKRVLSHGGYALSGRRDAIVVFSACYLPDSSRVDYNYVMDNLFLYVLTTLEQLVTDDYILVYLHGSASKRSMPTFHWLKKCYQLIDRRLRKSLKHLYLVHPTFWLKSIMWMTRPFISSKFSRKLSYVHTLEELEGLVPVEYASIPEKVRRYDSTRTSSI
ncbi:uncharacterized protein LOC143910373 [Arctopsyche grandis]|uniref:uncharacterized protein LOC143910373 n=1 Tax=Arctopsyche grandis TaxID=121162 RepID=UPI00406D7B45